MPKFKTTFNDRKDKPEDGYLTSCKKCRKGIFKNQEHEWTPSGLIHTGCKINESEDES
jgi:hypothetical protein